jgi:hypothetical protein
MRALLIDATQKRVRDVSTDGTLDDWYAKLDCRMVDMRDLDEAGRHALVIDDEGLFTKREGFTLGGEFYAGSGLVVGYDRRKVADVAIDPDGLGILFGDVSDSQAEAIMEDGVKVFAWDDQGGVAM